MTLQIQPLWNLATARRQPNSKVAGLGQWKVWSAALKGFDELGQNLVHIANNSEVSNSEDRCFLVLVDGDDVL